MTPLYFDEASYLGGGERYPLNLAKAVAMTGEYEVDIVSYGDVPEVTGMALEDRISLVVLPSASRLPGTDRLSWDVIGAIRDVDLVHAHQLFCRPTEVAVLVAKLLRKPLCGTDHGGATSQLGSSLKMLDLFDRIIAQSHFAASLVEGRTATRMDVVHGGVDDAFFTPGPGAAERDRVVFVGRLLAHKGVDRLLAALPAQVALSVCGRPYDLQYERVLRALAAGRDVEFVTSASDEQLRDLYRRAIAVVLPSVYVDFYGNAHAWPELMGFSLIEGMACGAPVICSRVGGMPEYVEHGVNGFVFDELAELTEQMELLSGDRALVERMGQQGRKMIETRFGLESAGRDLRAIYDEILEPESRRESSRRHESVPA